MWVFAVEPDAVQVTWRVGLDGRPGVQLFSDLAPATTHELFVEAAGSSVTVTTTEPPPGRELTRVATINDLHIGSDRFGILGHMPEPPGVVPHAVRCLRNALHQALAWGAQMIVVKGDLTHRGTEEEWETVGTELAGVPVPVAVVPGNHEVKLTRRVDPQPALGQFGLHLVHGVEVVDLPGVRLVLADTTIEGEDRGRIEHLAPEILRVARRADHGVLLAIHHHPERHRVSTFLPVGIPGREAHRFLDALAAANPRSFVTTGHTHRHRKHQHGPITVTEVGSTKDFPGTWTGYVVHEGGIRQASRRITDPTCLPWLDHTRRAALGLWGHWSPGTLDDRCFSITWPQITWPN